jgi:hypothetical protein
MDHFENADADEDEKCRLEQFEDRDPAEQAGLR